jgi:hypothetical protein
VKLNLELISDNEQRLSPKYQSLSAVIAGVDCYPDNCCLQLLLLSSDVFFNLYNAVLSAWNEL